MSLICQMNCIKAANTSSSPLLDEQLPQLEDIQGDKMSGLRNIFECLYEKTHPVAVDLFFMSGVKPIRIIESRT